MKKTLLYASIFSFLSIEAYGMTFKNNTDREVKFYIYADIGKAQLIDLFSLEPNAKKEFDIAKTLGSLKNLIVPNDFLEIKVKYFPEYSARCGERINVNKPADLDIDGLEKQTVELNFANSSGCTRQ